MAGQPSLRFETAPATSPLWGRFADRRGRRPALLFGLAGFAVSLLLFPVANSLLLPYIDRPLSGLFASAIAPASYALIGDLAPSKAWRAHRFALLCIAGATGFLVGPMLGGLTMHLARDLAPGPHDTVAYWPPLVVTAGLAVPVGTTNVAFVGQSCELPDDVVFTIEYSVRSAPTAVYSFLGVERAVPPLYKGRHDLRVLLNAFRTMIQ